MADNKLNFEEFVKYGKVFGALLLAFGPVVTVYFKVGSNEESIAVWERRSNKRYERAIGMAAEFKRKLERTEQEVEEIKVSNAKLQEWQRIHESINQRQNDRKDNTP